MDLSLRSIKTNNWSEDNFKKHVASMSCTLEPAIQSCEYSFWQLSIDNNECPIRMSTIKLNTDCIRLRLLASNARSLQETNARLAANQSARTTVAIW